MSESRMSAAVRAIGRHLLSGLALLGQSGAPVWLSLPTSAGPEEVARHPRWTDDARTEPPHQDDEAARR